MAIDLKELGAKVARALAAGRRAADASPDDGGSANLDHVVLCGLKNVREASLAKHGMNGWRAKGGTFHLYEGFGGQGNRRYVGVQAMAKALKADGVDCYVHYQMD